MTNRNHMIRSFLGKRNGRPGARGLRQRGATMVEFALFFIVFLMLSLAIMEFGRALWTYTTVAHAARQGARFAMVHGESNPVTDAEIEAYVESNAIGLPPSSLSVTTTWVPDNTSGSVVEIHVSYPFKFVTAPLTVTNNDLQLGSTSKMVIW